MVNFQDLFRSPYRCVSAPFSPLCPNNAALVEISSVLVEISSVLVRISSELVEISSELVLSISELLIISVFIRIPCIGLPFTGFVLKKRAATHYSFLTLLGLLLNRRMLARVGIAHWQNIGHHIVPPPKKKFPLHENNREWEFVI